MVKKAMSFLDFGSEGKRKKALFLLGTLRCFNLILRHNLMDIYCFFDPNCFSPSLALAREVWVYLKVWLTDPDIIEQLMEDPVEIRFELSIVLQLFNEIVKQFNVRLAYKDEQEQSKEFKNLYVIDAILLLFLDWKKFSASACPILVSELLANCQQLFQHICCLVGSFDFLLKHITENLLQATTIKEAELMRCLTFCIDSCYQNEARKKFLVFLKAALSEIKSKESKSTISWLLGQYGSDTFSNQLLALKDSQDTSNVLEHVLLRAVSIRDQESRLSMAEFLRSVAQFGDYSMISCVTRFLCHKTNQECSQLKDYGRASRELGNSLRLLALITKNPYYKSMLLAADALSSFNSVLKCLLQSGCKEEDFPILEVISNLFNPRVSINNLQRGQDDPAFIDPIPKDQLSEFCRISGDHFLTLISLTDDQESLDSSRLASLAHLFSALASFFDANYNDAVFYKEFLKKDASVIHSAAKVLQACAKQQARGLKLLYGELPAAVLQYVRLVAALFVPAVLNKDTYKSKRLRQIYQLLTDDKEADRLISLVNDLLAQLRVIEDHSQADGNSIWLQAATVWLPVQELLNSQAVFDSLYKTAPAYEERDLVKKTSHYDSLFDKTYDIAPPSAHLRGIELIRETVLATSELNEYKPVDFFGRKQPDRSQPTLEFTVQSNFLALEESLTGPLVISPDSNFIDSNLRMIKRNFSSH